MSQEELLKLKEVETLIKLLLVNLIDVNLKPKFEGILNILLIILLL